MLGSLAPRTRALAVAPGLDPDVAAAARTLAAARGWLVADATDVPGGVLLVPVVRADDGMPVDVAGAAARTHAGGGLVVTDLTMAAGSTDLALPALGADAAVLATDRWLLGPDGTAAAWLGRSLDALALERATTLADPLPRRSALGLGRSLGWLLMYVGLPWAAGPDPRGRRPSARPPRGDRGRDAARPRRRTGGAQRVLDRGLGCGGSRRRAGPARLRDHRPRPGQIRASVGAWTTTEELDRFAAAVAELAAHTPDTLPRRQPLTILGQGHAHG